MVTKTTLITIKLVIIVEIVPFLINKILKNTNIKF